MKIVINKVLCLMLSFLLVFSFSGCKKEKEQYKFKYSEDDFADFEKEESEVESGENKTAEEETSSKGNSKFSKSDTTNTSNNSSQSEEIKVTHIDEPSLDNCYKLSNSYYKLTNDKKLNVAYIGGSVTNGTGASDENAKSWRGLTGTWLRQKYPQANIQTHNFAIGGTGSVLGAARLEDCLKSGPFDLVFIEFVVNDGYCGTTAEFSKKNMEYMVRKIYSNNPYADIIFCFVTNKELYGKQGSIYKAQREVADHYGIPIADMGTGLFNLLQGSTVKWGTYFKDSVHPKDAGYAVYAEVAEKVMEKLLVSGGYQKHNVPDMLDGNGYSTLTNHTSDVLGDPTEFKKVTTILKDHPNLYPVSYAPKDEGSSISFEFEGNYVGLIAQIKNSKSSITVIVDGDKEYTTGEDAKSSNLDYAVFEGLSNGKHTLTVVCNGTDVAIASIVTGKK